jgi:hypothetical protein
MEDSSNILIESLAFSVRTFNCLKNANINSLDQLSALNESEISRIPNLGKKSLNEIKETLASLNLILHRNPYNFKKFENISEALDWVFEENYKFKKRKEILIDRIFNGHTLEACGQRLGVSRERVRQIESSLFKVLRKKLSEAYIKELEEYFKNNTGINGFIHLDGVGPAYTNISKYLVHSSDPSSFFKFLFENQEMLRWQKKKNGQYHFYPYNADSLDDFINDEKLLNFIKNSQSELLEDSVRIYCLVNNQEINFEYIFEEIQKKISKKATFACIYAVIQLKKSYTHITLNQVIDFLKENCNKDFSPQKRTLDNILSSFDSHSAIYKSRDISLYIANGSGNYFFLDKIGIDNDDKAKIINLALDMLKKNPNKNFNSVEFLTYFQETKTLKKHTLDILDKFIIDAVLLEAREDNDILNYLGRNSWSGNTNKLKQKRTEIYPSVIKMLEDSGHPITLYEIKDKITKIRGTGKNFQLHTSLTTPDIILVSQGLWGLRKRDINVSHKDELKILNLIKDEFAKGNKIIDFKYIKAFKELTNIDDNVSVYQLMRILSAHIPIGRRVTPDKLIFLLKLNRENPLNFCFYSPDISDQEASEYIESRAGYKFIDVRNNEDSMPSKRNYSNRD